MVVSALTFGATDLRFGGRTVVGVNPGRICCGVF